MNEVLLVLHSKVLHIKDIWLADQDRIVVTSRHDLRHVATLSYL